MIFFYSKKYGSKYRLWIGSKLAIVLSDAHDVEVFITYLYGINKHSSV